MAPGPVAVARGLGLPPALRGVDLEVLPGQVLGLLGPNGGGKSTLLLLLAGLLRPAEGGVEVEGIPATRLARQARGTVGLITTIPGLYPLLSGWENLDFFGRLYGLDPQEVRRRAQPLLERLDMLEAAPRPVKALSSGMQQKLSLARALLMDPRLLLLDEPTANLDPVSSWTIHEVIRERADRGLAVVLATHELGAAECVCDRVAFVDGGVRRLVTLEGPRRVPERGPLFALFEGGGR